MTAETLFGLHVDAMTMDETLARCATAVRDRRPLLIGVVNAAKIVRTRRDPLLRESLLTADVVLADGQAVVWAGRFLGHATPERIAGIDLFERLLEVADRERRSVYLLGASAEVLAEVEHQIAVRFPSAVVVGSCNGYYPDEDAQRIAEDIRCSGADMLFLGMSSPRKEIFLASYAATMQVPIMHGVGGSFDVLAGVVRRAPLRWQRNGFEWLYRVVQEPRRMWRRYLFTNTAFVALMIREWIRPLPPYPRPIVPAGEAVTVLGPVVLAADRYLPTLRSTPVAAP